jgi:hypothetical protein
MPNLLKKWCSGKGTIPTDLIKKLDIASFGMPVGTTLTELGWEGSLVAAVGLQLSPDNRQVQRGQFLLRGNLTKEPIEIQANILWPAAEPDIFLTITPPDGAAFLFNSGNLCSDLIACEDYTHSFRQNNRVIVPSEWKDKGVGETALRAVCHLDKTSNGRLGPRIKVTTLIFPRSVDEMDQLSDATQSPAWPGIRVLENTCDLFPKVKEWGEPVCPLFLRGSTYAEAPNIPPPDELRFHVAAIMRSAKRPTVCTKQKVLQKQWEKALENIEELEKEPSISWPEAPRHAPTKGKNTEPVIQLLLISNKFLYFSSLLN